MKTNTAFSLLAAASLALSGATFAAGAKTYQVTGTVVEMTGSKITVQKGTEKLEIDLDPTIKTTGDVKLGATVTITYVMSAMKVEGSAGAALENMPAVPSPASSP
jgi:type 1 fimbria pilin